MPSTCQQHLFQVKLLHKITNFVTNPAFIKNENFEAFKTYIGILQPTQVWLFLTVLWKRAMRIWSLEEQDFWKYMFCK